MSSVEDRIREVGFNSSVEHRDRPLHVQTEVVGRDALSIRTTVLAAGAVLLVEVQPFVAEGGDLGAARRRVAAHHQSVVDRVRRGEMGSR